jgi:flagellar biosynthetic protein FliR
MGLQVDPVWVTTALLLWLRLGALFFLTPLFAGFKGPNAVLVILSLALAGLLAAGWQKEGARVPTGAAELFIAGLGEVFLGMVLAFGVHAAFAAFNAAGKLLDLQIGFGAGATFDPVTRGNSPVLAAALSSLAVVVFFSMDAHHAFMRGLAFSVAEVPPGSLPRALAAEPMVRQFGAVFTLALSLIAPVFVVLLLLEAGIAVISRMLPQMNVFFVGMPVKLLLGLGMLALTAPVFSSVMARAYASIFTFWTGVLR